MHVGSQPHVVSEIPARMVGIFIDHNVVARPIPTVAVSVVIGSNAEVEAPEPEAGWSPSGQMPPVRRPEAAGKVPMLPGMVKVVVGIARPRVMPNPPPIGFHVRRIGMPRLIGKVPVRLGWRRRAMIR